jgi:2-hydroxy-3-keto-5-methylthiopentenyl-1-phosphate phosphatase
LQRKVAILTDFDGTITSEDCQVKLLDTLGRPDWREVEKRVLDRGGKSRQYYPEIFEGLRASAEEARSFIVTRAQVDPGFSPFIQFCDERGISLEITSDGLEFYLRPLLGEATFDRLPVTYNRVDLDARPPKFAFPFHNPECGLCGACKTARVNAYHDKGYYVIYVGDGISDECPAERADEVWARRHLLRWCERQEIPYREFTGFVDLQRELSERFGFSGGQ